MTGIIFIQDIRYCPYLFRYTEALRRENETFDLIWWERWETPPTTPLPEAAKGAAQLHVFNKYSRMAQNPLGKLGDFAAFSRFVRDKIKKRRYDRLILLTTMSGVILSDLLLGKYRGRYLLDIRDYSYEHLGAFRSIEGKIIDASALTCISSEGFREFLPENRDYVLTDNFMDADLRRAEGAVFRKKAPGEPLRVSYIGFIRYFEENYKVLTRLMEDERFIIAYHGAGADYERLLEFKAQHGYDRLEVTGYYDLERDKAALCQRADIINNFYPYSLRIQRQATTNKHYDAIIYRRPQLVSAGTYSQRLVESLKLGCALDVAQPDFMDSLYKYYQALDEDAFNESAVHALSEILARDLVYREKISEFIRA